MDFALAEGVSRATAIEASRTVELCPGSAFHIESVFRQHYQVYIACFALLGCVLQPKLWPRFLCPSAHALCWVFSDAMVVSEVFKCVYSMHWNSPVTLVGLFMPKIALAKKHVLAWYACLHKRDN